MELLRINKTSGWKNFPDIEAKKTKMNDNLNKTIGIFN